MISKDYKETICYKSMNKDYQDSFDRLVNTYGKKLNENNPLANTLFTPHNFNNHCIDIFNIIDKIILKKHNTLSEKENYLLCLSVLFHDISMAVQVNWDRKRHSIQSAEYLNSEYTNPSSPLNLEINTVTLRHNDINAVSKIITAHSDIKDGTVSNEENGIFNKELENTNNEVSVKLLAAILRLADELDITSDRLNSENFALQLSDENSGQHISKQHWKNLHYFSNLQINSNDTSVLFLCCDDSYIRDNNDDLANISYNIKKIKEKIDYEIKVLNEEVFKKIKYSKVNFTITKTEVVTKIDELTKFLSENDTNIFLNPIDPNNISNGLDANCESSNTEISKNSSNGSLDVESQKKLDSFIISKRLFIGGHYIITEKYCATDWINSNEIIETKRICEMCVRKFAEDIINEKYDNNSIILGLDFSGSIIAAQLASSVNMPFQFVIPTKSTSEHAREDINNDLPNDKAIILVTDVIATYSTVISVIEELGIKDRIKRIYAILYREPTDNIYSKSTYKNITNFISDSFPINILDRNKCIYNGNGKCIALNKNPTKNNQ